MEEQYKKQNESEKVEGTYIKSTSGKNIGMAVVAYILFFVPLLTDDKDDPFVMFHVKQGLVIFIAWAMLSVLFWTPFMVLAYPAQLLLIVLVVLGIMNALHGKEEPLPVIGKFAEHFDF